MSDLAHTSASSPRGLNWTLIGSVVATVGVPVVIALVGVLVPIAYQQSRDIGRIDQKLTEMSDRSKVQFDDFDKAIKRFESSIDKYTDRVDLASAEIKKFGDRLSDRETDPIAMARRLGIQTNATVSGAVIDGKVFLFPLNTGAEQSLLDKGLKRTNLSPVLTGFELPPIAKQDIAPPSRR